MNWDADNGAIVVFLPIFVNEASTISLAVEKKNTLCTAYCTVWISWREGLDLLQVQLFKERYLRVQSGGFNCPRTPFALHWTVLVVSLTSLALKLKPALQVYVTPPPLYFANALFLIAMFSVSGIAEHMTATGKKVLVTNPHLSFNLAGLSHRLDIHAGQHSLTKTFPIHQRKLPKRRWPNRLFVNFRWWIVNIFVNG